MKYFKFILKVEWSTRTGGQRSKTFILNSADFRAILKSEVQTIPFSFPSPLKYEKGSLF